MTKAIWILLAFIAGAFLPIQAGLNAKLGKAAGSAVQASLISFSVGTLCLLLYVLISQQTLSWSGIKTAPLHAWLGGLLGAIYVTLVILAFPRLGPGLTFGLVVAGQMIISSLLEHYNILVAQPHPISWIRLGGMALIIAGVVILRKF